MLLGVGEGVGTRVTQSLCIMACLIGVIERAWLCRASLESGTIVLIAILDVLGLLIEMLETLPEAAHFVRIKSLPIRSLSSGPVFVILAQVIGRAFQSVIRSVRRTLVSSSWKVERAVLPWNDERSSMRRQRCRRSV